MGHRGDCSEPGGKGVSPLAWPFPPGCRSLELVPKPPVPPRSELDEVERAISVLGGRHPDHERTRRETLAAAEERRVSIERELLANLRRRRRRVLVMAANVVALGVAGLVVWQLVTRARRIRDALARDEAAFLRQGFEESASNQLAAQRVLEADTPGSSCFVAIGTAGNLVVSLGGSSISGGHSVGWCGCTPGHVTLQAATSTDVPSGLALLRVDAKVIGGPLARAWLTARPEVWADGGADCADAMLDAWMADHRCPKPVLVGAELDSLQGAAELRAIGFHVSSVVAPGMPFAVVDSAADDCELAVASGAELSLRTTGGARPIDRAHGAMLWCASLPEMLSVWATGGTGRALVLSAPASRLGGLLGAREGASDAGYPVSPDATWLHIEDQGWDATSILRASTITDIATGPVASEPGAPDARVAAIVASAMSGVTWQPSPADVSCEPPLDVSGRLGESICVPAAAAVLWKKGDAPAAVARGALPLWTSTLSQRHEREAVALLPRLLSFARRLTREGFEPTAFEGVTELRSGVRITGRAGEDAVVALGLAPSPPWVFPYSDAAQWNLGDAPRIIALKPGATVTLTSPARFADPPEKRRTIVFRRTARP